MTAIYAYIALLGSLVLLANGREAPMKRTVITLAVVCVLSYSFTLLLWNDWKLSAFMVCVDALACKAITWKPAGKWQAVIGASFLIQIGAHLGRIGAELSNPAFNPDFFWWTTTIMAYAQLGLVAGWRFHENISRRFNRGADHSLAHRSDS